MGGWFPFAQAPDALCRHDPDFLAATKSLIEATKTPIAHLHSCGQTK
jgi:hypothetical protein